MGGTNMIFMSDSDSKVHERAPTLVGDHTFHHQVLVTRFIKRLSLMKGKGFGRTPYDQLK